MLEEIFYKIEHGIDIGYIEYDWFVSYITALEDTNKLLKDENEKLKSNQKKAIEKINSMFNVFPGFRNGKTIISENLIEVLNILGDDNNAKDNKKN